MEAESALLKLESPLEEQLKLRSCYLNLREEYRKSRQAPRSPDIERRHD
jgi:hypothetical protein